MAIITGVWYFVWYGQHINNGEPVLGIMACCMFGYALYYMVGILDSIKNKEYFRALSNSLLTWYMLYLQFNTLQIMAGNKPVMALTSKPLGFNPHIIGPLACIWIFILTIIGCLFGELLWVIRHPPKICRDEYYPGKILLNKLKFWRKN